MPRSKGYEVVYLIGLHAKREVLPTNSPEAARQLILHVCPEARIVSVEPVGCSSTAPCPCEAQSVAADRRLH